MESKKALIIDDEQMMVDTIGTILSAKGYSVEGALSSRKGLEMALMSDFDLVFTDIRMPEIGGMKVLRDIKRLKPRLPVIIITGYSTVKTAVQAMRLGAADYLEKPLNPEELLDSAEAAIKNADRASPEEQRLIHKEEFLKVLERTAEDEEFGEYIQYHGADALEEYELTGPEKLSLLTGDLHWIKEQIGNLTHAQSRWLEKRRNAVIW